MSKETALTETERELLEALAETGLRYSADAIANRFESESEQIQPTLEELVEQGYVVKSGGENPRYRISGDGRVKIN